jgi:hypothetical protein
MPPHSRRRHHSPRRRDESARQAAPVADAKVIWPLVDAAAGHLRPTDRWPLFADIAAGDYLSAVKQVLTASLNSQQPLPMAVLNLVDTWLDRYAGASGHPSIRALVEQAKLVAGAR